MTSPFKRVSVVVVAPPRNVPRPVNVDTPETVMAPVSAMVPSVALVIVSPFKRVIEVDEATPFIWTTPSVALLMTSPFKSVIDVVVAPPKRDERPVTDNVPPVLMFVLIVVAACTKVTESNMAATTANVT